MKIKASQEQVYVLEEQPKAKDKPSSSGYASGLREAVKRELDLRGMMTDEAIPALQRYIDSASMNKLEQVTIIHGKGTGALRAAVQQDLKTHRAVKKFRLGRYGEGEDGVTIVELK
jgi:DNA mismatch repair protein MutS2